MNSNVYQYSTADWRKQLRINEHRTKVVIGLFILIYMAVGFLVDLYLHTGTFYAPNGEVVSVPLEVAFQQLITFQIIPIATIVVGFVAIIAVFAVFALHDKLMLMGTEYHEVTSEGGSLEERKLYNVIEEMKTAAGLKFMPKIYIIDADYMNAFASGYSEKSAMVAITRGLMQKLNRSELQAVMAHELSHIRHHDIKLTLMASVLSNIMLMIIDVLFYSMIFSRDRRDNKLAGIIILLRFLLPFLTVILLLYLSRTREYMADAGCVELTRDNMPLANALMKISQDHADNSETYGRQYYQTPHEDVRRAAYIFDPVQAGIEPVQSFATMFSTHPSIEQRLKAIGIKYSEK